METLFESKTILRKDLFAEAMEAVFKATKTKYRIFVFIFFVISILFAAYFFNLRMHFYGILILLASVYFLFLYLKAYLLHINKAYKVITVDNPSCQKICNFYDDHFDIIALRSNIKIEYPEIARVIETKNSILLLYVIQYTVIDKSGFEKGDYGSFKSFLKSKCPNACKHMD